MKGVLLLFLAFPLLVECQSKSVLVSLNSNWNSTSLLAETSEFIANEDNALFFDFIKLINKGADTVKWNELTDEKKYDYTIEKAKSILAPSTVDFLKFSLSLRQYSPAVQSHQQITTDYKIPDCDAFIVVKEKVACDTNTLDELLSSSSENEQPIQNEHIYGKAGQFIVMYGDIGKVSFAKLYEKLVKLADEKKIKFAVRHFNKHVRNQLISLSGYGVELAIKNTEYKAVDETNTKKEAEEDETDLYGFNIKLLKEKHQDLTEQIEAFRANLKDTDELSPLKKWEIQDLSFQAAQKLINTDKSSAIETLEDISQNFPIHARTIARTTLTQSLKKEVTMNQKFLEKAGVEPGETTMFINGIQQDINSLDVYKLADLLKNEDKISSGFYEMGINNEYLSILVGMDSTETDEQNYAIDYREGYPLFFNNLDSDKKYKQWSNSVKLMLQPYYPGMIRPIARNLFTLVFVVDPSTEEGRRLIRIGSSFYNHDIAMRIGFIFTVNDDPNICGNEDVGVALLNLINFLSTEMKQSDALKLFINFLDSYRNTDPTVDDVKRFFSRKYADENVEDVFGKNSDYDKGRKTGMEFLRKSGLQKAPKVLLNGYVLSDEGIQGDVIEETIMREVMRITPKLQRAVMEGRLTDRANVAKWIMEQKDVLKRINKRVLNAPSKHNFVNLYGSTKCGDSVSLDDILVLSKEDQARCMLDNSMYMKKSSEDSINPLTFWVVADADSVEGREFLFNSMHLLKLSDRSRIAFILNPTDLEKSCSPNSISNLIRACLKYLSPRHAKEMIRRLVNEEYAKDIVSGKTSIQEIAIKGIDVEKFMSNIKKITCDELKVDSHYARNVIGVEAGDRAVVGNALIVGPLDKDEKFEEGDFEMFENFMMSRGAKVISDHLTKWHFDASKGRASNTAVLIAGLIEKYGSGHKRTWVTIKYETNSVITLPADDKDRSAIDVVVVVDPLSAEAQKVSSILKTIKIVTNSDIKIIMNPKEKLSELPLKRFYRFEVPSEITFDSNGNINQNIVKFDKLPSKQLLTMSLHAPDSWIVEAVAAEYDLDNIKMEQVNKDVEAVYALQHLLLEGQCFDEHSGQPPRGLQFILGTETNPAQFDTIVMANLGYFQLKANPGAWNLQLREGKSKQIYKMGKYVGGEEIKPGVLRAVINSFNGKSVRVRVEKHEGMEERSLLSDEDDSVWSSVTNMLANQPEAEMINVFSLASGHLYERFMRIMFVSVMKNTKKPVKFWLLKNYLSPQFKKTLPIIAEHYGFQYELVEYKWPRWLNQQKVKQRIMWGYKILFLDVLFPLDLQKIIFVDADQVVRADLMELMNFDLGGAPYGYVPFCESRKEMDGFRFWKQGYWANHLAGRKYHISALYVIDLQKFRQIAAGDRLRGQYQGLSADPNSLANLDQDLPNNMIHQVKIKSLPQEWLWCETWCDDGSKKDAKTIDLCNNPLTKEPKLDSATRIIGEWKTYDDEIKSVIEGKVQQSVDKADAHEEL